MQVMYIRYIIYLSTLPTRLAVGLVATTGVEACVTDTPNELRARATVSTSRQNFKEQMFLISSSIGI